MHCIECGDKLLAEAKFCGQCGTKVTTPYSPSSNEISEPSCKERANFVEIAAPVFAEISGTLSKSVRQKFCEIVGVKKYEKVLTSVYVSKHIVLLAPHSKDRSGLAVAGIALTGGAGLIGALGMSAGAAVGRFLSERESKNNQALMNDFRDKLVFDASTVELSAYDYRRHWDFAGGEWETRIAFSGVAFLNGEVGDCKFVFAVDGKTYAKTFLLKANEKVPQIAKLLGRPTPTIREETKLIW